MKSYDYQNRQGVQEITWDGFAEMTAKLTEIEAALAAQKSSPNG